MCIDDRQKNDSKEGSPTYYEDISKDAFTKIPVFRDHKNDELAWKGYLNDLFIYF